MQKFCKTLSNPCTISTPATVHGIQMEKVALKKFENDFEMHVVDVGLCIDIERPYLAASPDGLIAENFVLEIKCPFSGKDSKIEAGKFFPFLTKEKKLKTCHKYYAQIQGQMYVTKRKRCYFVVYTLLDMLVINVNYDKLFVESVLLPRLDDFYKTHFRPYLAKHLT